MKRNERKVYNSLKKSVNQDTIYVEIPTTFTQEARQAMHELLTTEKGMHAVCIGPEVISHELCIRYARSTSAEQQRTRMQQEIRTADDVVAELPTTEYTWNGYHVEPAVTLAPADLPAEQCVFNDVPQEKTAAEYTEQNNVRGKIRAAFETARARLEAGEEMHVYFSEGNSKTHIPSIDLLPLFTCHGRCRTMCGEIRDGKKLPDCYAAKIANRFPDVLRHYAENTVLAIYRPRQYWQEVRAKMQLSRYMRLFVSGDMIIRGYFHELCSALDDVPTCEMQGFSKCYEIVNREIDARGGSLPKNLHLLLSGWNETTPINPYSLPTTNVYTDERPENWLSCGGNCANCICVGLGCWKAGPGDVVGFKKH